MRIEDKQLLLKDICARLPYVVKYNFGGNDGCDYTMDRTSLIAVDDAFPIEDIKPYLRPMSSMTDEERKEYENLFEYEEREYNQGCCFFDEYKIDIDDEYRLTTVIDWLNSHYFDFRGLIEKGLAIEAPANMYKND